jgi:hypothetical protein
VNAVRRLLALLLLLLIVGVVLALLGVFNPVSLLPEAVATNLALPEAIANPASILESIPTLLSANTPEGAGQDAPGVVIQGTPYLPATPAPTQTEMPAPPKNGRLLYLGLDENIYSISMESDQPLLLGKSADFHIFPGMPWYSPDGRSALVLQDVDGVRSLVIVPIDGSGSPLVAGSFETAAASGLPRQFFEFSPDSRRFLWVEKTGVNALLNAITLADGARYQLPLAIERSVVNQAAFYGDSDHILVANKNQEGIAYVSVYYLAPDGFLETERLVELPGWELVQFSASPDGRYVALVLQDVPGQQAVYLVDTVTKEVIPILGSARQEILLAPPAWTPNGSALLFNQWGEHHQFLAYHVASRSLDTLLASEPSSAPGTPLTVVKTFAPDHKALGLVNYSDDLTWESFWLAVLDGSYLRKITQADRSDPTAPGEYVTGIAPDWTSTLMIVIEPGLPFGSLMRATLDGGQRVLLDDFVPAQFSSLGPAVSPDGRMVAYFRFAPGAEAGEIAELCVVGVDGGARQVLVSGGGAETSRMPGIPLIWLPAMP